MAATANAEAETDKCRRDCQNPRRAKSPLGGCQESQRPSQTRQRKRKLSAAGRARLVALARARWAKVKAAGKISL